MVESRWVNCRFCEQTFIAGQGDGCSLCGKGGGLVDVFPPTPSPYAEDQKSWAVPEGPDSGTSLAAGCLLVIIGTVVGVGIAYLLPEVGLEQAAQKPAFSWADNFFARLFTGAFLGAVCGGLIAAVLLLLLPRWKGRRR
jgi:hypothetical protein